MRIISESTIKAYAAKHSDAAASLAVWIDMVRAAQWTNMSDVRAMIPTASIVTSEHIVFNIAHNRYRLVVKAWFPKQQLYVKFVGTHAEYDTIKVSEL